MGNQQAGAIPQAAPGIYPFTCVFQGPLSYARFPFMLDGRALEEPGCVISSRRAGNMVYSAGANSPVREAFYRSLGLEPPGVFACTQVHSRNLVEVDCCCPNLGPEADGMISRDPGAVLSVTVADCLPVYLYDAEGGGFALVHSGWKGTGIALAALRLMGERWGTRPEGVAAVLGPCIRSCCYRVDRERAQVFDAEFGGPGGAYPLGPVTGQRYAADAAALEISQGGLSKSGMPREPQFFIDLQAANARLLANAGVRNIAVCRDCTCGDERFGSFRREGAGYTRMAAALGYGL